MTGAITSTDFQQKAVFGDGRILEAVALPSSTSYTTDAFVFAQALSAIALRIEASGAIVIADTKTLKIELYDCATEDGSFTLAKTLYDKTASGEETIADETDLVNFVPGDDVLQWCKIKITTTSDLSDYALNAYKYSINP